MSALNRRRFLSIAAASAALPAMTLAATNAIPTAQWRGRAMGAATSMKLVGLDNAAAAPIFAAVEQELSRLEGIFSLYRTDSEIARLNRDGVLAAPSLDLLAVLSLSDQLNRASDGAFDPTIQPLWLAVATGKTGADLDHARGLVGWHALQFDAREVRFDRAGRGLTLNGVAQGFVTDRIARLLKSHGLHDVLIDMGEIAALGRDADGSDWAVGVASVDGTVVQRLQLRDRALATSAPMGTPIGTPIGGARTQGHIFTAQSSAPTRDLVSISAPNAALADGLSTSLCLLSDAKAQQMMQHFPQAKIEAIV